MAEGVFTVPITFASHDGESEVHAKIWTCAAFGDGATPSEAKPKAIIQIVHGMSEYIERYDHIATYMVEHGFIVCAEDHIGHGKTAPSPDYYGHMPVHGGKEILIEDVNELRQIVSGCFPGIPYVMYGHSMGSFITRAYIARYGEGLAAVVLSGSGNPPTLLSGFGNLLSRTLAKFKGEKSQSEIMTKLTTGDYASRIEGAKTPLDWLSTDDEVVQTYFDDPQSGFSFTLGGYATLTSLTAEVGKLSCVAKVPKTLPILFISGDQDPVGDMGKGVLDAAKLMQDAGMEHVEVKLYPGLRHELHNEVGKESIYDDVIDWIDAQLPA